MTKTIQALHDEIEAAEEKLAKVHRSLERLGASWLDIDEANLVGYIRGLQTAVRLLEQDEVRELPR